MIHLPILDDFLLSIKTNNYSDETIYNYERDLILFQNFLNDINTEYDNIDKKTIENYKAYLTSKDRKTTNKHTPEKKLAPTSINRMLSSVRNYIKYLIEMDYVSPVAPEHIKLIKTIKRHAQVADLHDLVSLIESPTSLEKNKLLGLRNRAMLELLFSTGMRISELINLKQDQIDKAGRIFILGKGKKERFVYMTPRAKQHLDNYLKTREDPSPYMFIPYRGANSSDKNKKISANYLQAKIKQYRLSLGINVPTSAHSLRHGFATYLAESGANPAAIQILLGHESLDTTTRYVHASDRYAEKVHKACHPLKEKQ